jgi:2-C-methyl-D-erythritol 2,4-cyclodiphosphate synthase
MKKGPRIGYGYDVHPLGTGRKLILGGIEIPHSKGLLGHSDSDVLVHAICDALLGAMGEGDLGRHYPSSDPKYKGISSLTLLKDVLAKLKNNGYRIGNIDTVIVAQAEDDVRGDGNRSRFDQRQGQERGGARCGREGRGHDRARRLFD